jgi:hypothetical protein
MPDDKPRFSTDDPVRQKAREEADVLMTNPPAALQAWADRQGVSLTKRDSGVWMHTQRKLERAGLWGVAKLWLDEAIHELRKEPDPVTRHKRVAKEIAMRCILEQMHKPRKSLSFRPHDDDGKDLECLPRDLRWIYCHPALIQEADENDPLIRAVISHYERNHKAPHHGAISRFKDCREDPAARKELFKEIKDIQLAYRKKQLTPVDSQTAEPAEKSKEQQAMEELFDQELNFEDELVKEGGEA